MKHLNHSKKKIYWQSRLYKHIFQTKDQELLEWLTDEIAKVYQS